LTVVIEPGRAFGTGHHGTTEGCLVLLEEALAVAPGAAVLDIGTGTGILAIAALRLGAAAVLAIDVDPDAIAATAVNAERNGCRGLIARLAEPQDIAEPAPIVLANLLTNTHLALAPHYARLVTPGGQLVLGGMLEDEDDRVGRTLAARGFERRSRLALEGWASLRLAAPTR
jgi:ribosomal protein L11 methyltransferase